MADGIENSTPRRGWTCIEIVDLGPDPLTWPVCEMCRVATPRYAHMMQHPDHPGVEVSVGCICAGWMEQDPKAARERETEFSMRRDRWLTRRGWRVSKRANPYINVQGCNVVVWHTLTGWRFRVKHVASRITWERDDALPTKDEARLAAFDKLPKHFPEFR